MFFDWDDKYEQRKGMIQYKAHKVMHQLIL